MGTCNLLSRRLMSRSHYLSSFTVSVSSELVLTMARNSIDVNENDILMGRGGVFFVVVFEIIRAV